MERVKILEFINRGNLIRAFFAISGFLLGRVVFFGSINAVAIAYLSCFAFRDMYYTVAISALIGILSVRGQMYIGQYIIALGLLSLLHYLGRDRVNTEYNGLFGGLALLSGALLCAGFTGNFLYYCVIGLLEAVFTVFMCYVLQRSVALIRTKGEKQYISDEETLSLFLLTMAMVCGSGNLVIFGVPIVILTTVTVLFASGVKGGCSLALACSVCEGIVLFFSSLYRVEIIPTLALSALASILALKIHRGLMPLGFAIAFLPLALYYKLDVVSLGTVVAIGLAGLINMKLPDKLYLSFASIVNTGLSQYNSYTEEIKYRTELKLKNISKAFTRLSLSLDSDTATEENPDIAFEVFDKCTSSICNRCARQTICWQDNYKNTYSTLYGLVSQWVEQNSVDTKNLPNYFVASCSRHREVTLWVKDYLDTLRFKKILEDKNKEYIRLLSLHIDTVAQITEAIAEDIEKDTAIDKALSERLYTKLSHLHIKSVVAFQTERGLRLNVDLPQCYNCNLCVNRLLPCVNDALDVKLTRAKQQCVIERGMCHLTLIEEPPVRVTAYCCSLPKGSEEICGDSFTYMDLENGKYLLALADGMGSGKNAQEESAATVEMYEEFVEVGFARDTALELINSALLTGKHRESFSTLDICTIDKYSGKAEFVKIGAVSTFIVSEKGVEVLKANTLPVGILGSVDTEIYERPLEKGDILVMVTDGILDSTKEVIRNEEWLTTLLREHENTTPEQLSRDIIGQAIENGQNKVCDDMTVLVANIF